MRMLVAAIFTLLPVADTARAEVALTGDARMGVLDGFSTVGLEFSSRVRVTFNMSGETDSGLRFGATFRADNAIPGGSSAGTIGGATIGRSGKVFIEGALGRIEMGDFGAAAEIAVGNVDGVGFTGLGDLHETAYFADGSGTSDPSVNYIYSTPRFLFAMSTTNPASLDRPAYAAGLAYDFGQYRLAIGYEKKGQNVQVILGARATFGDLAFKADYGRVTLGAGRDEQMHISATYTADVLAVTAFYGDDGDLGVKGYGIGASYDLGGGAKVIGGYAKHDTDDADAFDMGVSFSF